MRRGMRPREVSFSYVSSLGEKSFVKDALYWQGEWNDKRLSMLLGTWVVGYVVLRYP